MTSPHFSLKSRAIWSVSAPPTALRRGRGSLGWLQTVVAVSPRGASGGVLRLSRSRRALSVTKRGIDSGSLAPTARGRGAPGEKCGLGQ